MGGVEPGTGERERGKLPPDEEEFQDSQGVGKAEVPVVVEIGGVETGGLRPLGEQKREDEKPVGEPNRGRLVGIAPDEN